jgi:hypothetical protein
LWKEGTLIQPADLYTPQHPSPRDAVIWLLALVVLPPGCIVFTAVGRFAHPRTVVILSALAVLLSAWICLRRRTFDHPRIAVMAALVLVAWTGLGLGLARETYVDYTRAKHAEGCRIQLKQVGSAVHWYAFDHGDAYPPNLQALIDGKYIRDTSLLICPASGDKPGTSSADEWSSYVYAQIKTTVDSAGLGDVPIAWDKTPHPKSPPLRVLFAGGGAEACEFWDFAERLERARRFYVTRPVLPPFPESERVNVNAAIERARREMKEAPPPPARD